MELMYDLYGKYQSILHKVDDVYIPLDPKWKSVAISLSGGADSAMLTYILCQLIEKNKFDIEINIITNVRMWKLRPWQEVISLEVYNYFKDQFDTLNLKRYVNFIPPEFEMGNGTMLLDEYGKSVSGDNIEIRSFSEYTMYHNNIDAYYNAVSKNPDDESITLKMESRSLTPSKENSKLMIMEHMEKIICHPFRFIDKRWIIKQYDRLKLQDLLNITRSCEGDKESYPEVFGNLDYQTYQKGQFVPECKKCFWCQEREWAIEQYK